MPLIDDPDHYYFSATVKHGQGVPFARVLRWADDRWLDPADPKGLAFAAERPAGGIEGVPVPGDGTRYRFAIPIPPASWPGVGIATVFVHAPGAGLPFEAFDVELGVGREEPGPGIEIEVHAKARPARRC